MTEQCAAIYARVITLDQSCERQIAALTGFADRGGFVVIGAVKRTASGTKANLIIDLTQTAFSQKWQAVRYEVVITTAIHHLHHPLSAR